MSNETEPTPEEAIEDIIVFDIEKEEPVWKKISRADCILTLIKYHDQGMSLVKDGERLVNQVAGIFKQLNIENEVESITIQCFIDQFGNITTEMREKDPMGFVVPAEVIIEENKGE